MRHEFRSEFRSRGVFVTGNHYQTKASAQRDAKALSASYGEGRVIHAQTGAVVNRYENGKRIPSIPTKAGFR